MSKITIKRHIVGYHFDHMPNGAIHWALSGGDEAPKLDSETLYTFPHTIEVEVPDDINVVAAQLAGIERAKEAARAEFTARMSELNAQASKLMALEMV
jgi:hypothetical protein